MDIGFAQFAPDQAVKVPGRVLEQRNPWGGVPGIFKALADQAGVDAAMVWRSWARLGRRSPHAVTIGSSSAGATLPESVEDVSDLRADLETALKAVSAA